jgi:uncharacterized membrane protein
MLAATIAVLVLALVPPLLSPAGRAAVMHLFAPVCHQIPVRSPHLGGVQIAICDRCAGIYVGLVVGVATALGARGLWRRVAPHERYVLLGSLVPIGLDWAGPLLGLWPNGPVSRVATGLLFGVVAASFAADRLLRAVRRARRSAPQS